MHIRFITTGGTIDKIYFDALSDYHVGESPLQSILLEGLVDFEHDIVPLLRKDSLEITDEDRAALREYIADDDATHYVITHGTGLGILCDALQGGARPEGCVIDGNRIENVYNQLGIIGTNIGIIS